MAYYYYVKAGGTATGTGGRYSSPKTGNWASAFSSSNQYYGSIKDAAIRTFDNLDIVCLSNSHSEDIGIALYGDETYGSLYQDIALVSVSDSSVNTLSSGAVIELGNPANYRSFYFSYFYGVSFSYNDLAESGNDRFGACPSSTASPGSSLYDFHMVEFNSCVFEHTVESDPPRPFRPILFANRNIRFKGCYISVYTYSPYIQEGMLSNNVYPITIELIDTIIETAQTSDYGTSLLTNDNSDLKYAIVDGCSFTSYSPLAENHTVYADKCSFYLANAGYSGTQRLLGTALKPSYVSDSGNTAVSSGDSYSLVSMCGQIGIYSTTSVYVNASFDGTEKYAFRVKMPNTTTFNGYTLSNASRFPISSLMLSLVSPKKISVRTAVNNSGSALKKYLVWLEAIYKDTSSSFRMVSSRPTISVGFTNSDTHAIDTYTTWTGLTSPTKQVFGVNLPASSVTSTQSVLVYLCVEGLYENSDLEFYADPELIVE
jgi:hypothetical protein